MMSYMIAWGRVSWFKLDKKFGFVELEEGMGDAFLHVSVLKAAGYVTIPAVPRSEYDWKSRQTDGGWLRSSRSTPAPRLRASQRQLGAKTLSEPSARLVGIRGRGAREPCTGED